METSKKLTYPKEKKHYRKRVMLKGKKYTLNSTVALDYIQNACEN